MILPWKVSTLLFWIRPPLLPDQKEWMFLTSLILSSSGTCWCWQVGTSVGTLCSYYDYSALNCWLMFFENPPVILSQHKQKLVLNRALQISSKCDAFQIMACSSRVPIMLVAFSILQKHCKYFMLSGSKFSIFDRNYHEKYVCRIIIFSSFCINFTYWNRF